MAIIIHTALAIAQVGGALATGSAAIASSAAHIAVGATAHLSSLGGIWLSTRPPDERHPYGYERFDSLGAFLTGMLLLAAVTLIVVLAVPRILDPSSVDQPGWGAVVMIASALANGALFLVFRAKQARLSSQILQSESTHALADGFTALAVVAGLAANSAGLLRLDPVVALGLGAFVAWRAWSVVQNATGVLTDVAPVDVQELRRIASSVPGVRGCHAVRSRGAPGHVRIDMHIHVDRGLTVGAAHDIALEVEAAIARNIANVAEVLVHIGATPE